MPIQIDMDMPENCMVCKFRGLETFCYAKRRYIPYTLSKRAKFCPLKEVK